MPRRRLTAVVGLAVAWLVLSGCGASGSGAPSGSAVVATTTVWGDIARQVVECAGTGTVKVLMPVGADPHDFSPSSEDVAAMASAKLVIANDLGLEEGLQGALNSARSDGATVLEMAPLLDPIPFGSGTGSGGAGTYDPHVWLDAARVATGARLIGDALATAEGDGRLRECGVKLESELNALNDQIAATLARVPEKDRVLVTDHDAFGYFAKAYGYTVAGTVIPGGSTLGEPSSAEMAALVQTVRETGVPAIFANVANPQVLIDALAKEVGNIAVVPLFVDGLGAPGSGADTYQGMMRTDAQRISDALSR